MEHGPTTTSRRGSCCPRMLPMASRPRTTVVKAAAEAGSASFKLRGVARRATCFTCKSWVCNIRQSLYCGLPVKKERKRGCELGTHFPFGRGFPNPDLNPNPEFKGSKFKVQSSKFKVQSSKFKVQSSKFKVQSSK